MALAITLSNSRKLHAVSTVLLCVLALLCGHAATAATLSFDNIGLSTATQSTLPDPAAYQSVGALLENPEGSTITYFRDGHSGAAAHSPPYAIMVGTGSQNYGTLRVRFVLPGTAQPASVSFVSGWVGDASSETETLTVTAYAPNGTPLATDSFTTGVQPNGVVSLGQISVSAPGIAYVDFTSTHAANVDDIEFGTPTSVPGLGRWGGFGLMGLVVALALVELRRFRPLSPNWT